AFRLWYVPPLGGGRDEHFPGLGSHLAQVIPGSGSPAAATGDQILVEARNDRSLLDPDLRPIGFELLRHHHGIYGSRPLPHLWNLNEHDDLVIGGNAQPRIGADFCARISLRTACGLDFANVESEHQSSAGTGACGQEGSAAHGLLRRHSHFSRRLVCGPAHRPADALICRATADVAGHRAVDFVRCGVRVLLEQRGRLHDLAGLAVTALWDLFLDPGTLHGVQNSIPRESLDGRDSLRAHGTNSYLAGAGGATVQMNGAGAAQSQAAAIFGASEAERVAQYPQQWRLGSCLDLVPDAVYRDHKFGHMDSPFCRYPKP